MTNPPTVEGHKNWSVGEVSDQVVEPFALRKGTVSAVVAHYKQCPKHGSLHQPKDWIKEPGIEGVGDGIQTCDDANI